MVVVLLIILAVFLLSYYLVESWQVSGSLILVLSVIGLLGYFLVLFLGHYFEKLFNRLNMWHKGVRFTAKGERIKHKFIEFDLLVLLQWFYKRVKNEDNTLIGLDASKANREVFSITDLQRSQHLQVLGMTGTGKTESIFLPLIYQDALKNRPVIILDAKGEMRSIDHLNTLLKSIGRADDFMLFSLSHKNKSCTYNPLYVGECDPQIVIDAFFNNFEDDNSFYRETAKTIFTNTFFILYSLGKPFTPMDVYTYLTDEQCRLDTNKLVESTNKDGQLHLKLLDSLLSKLIIQYKGWQHVITGFNNYLLDHRDDVLNEDDSDIVLTDVIRNRKIVYFQLPTNAYPIQAVSIARMVQANLRYISSMIQTGQLPRDLLVSVIIDEYASFAEESFVEVLNKARSSGMMVTLSHQSLSDLTSVSQTFMKRIDENTLNKIYFRQTDPQLCELIAKSMGTYTKEEKTYRMIGGKFGNQVHNGESSNRIVHEFHFPPDLIKNLHKYGQGYFVYRADNTFKCINFGRFKIGNIETYQKKVKADKQTGLRLFEEYYLKSKKKTLKPKRVKPQETLQFIE